MSNFDESFDGDVDENYVEDYEGEEIEGEEIDGEEIVDEDMDMIDEDMDIVDEEQVQNEDHEIERENDNESEIIRNRKRSWVWNYFLFDDNIKKARCNLCKALITTSKGSTTGMSNHMKSRHKITKDGNEERKNQLTLQESINSSKDLVSSIYYLILFFDYSII